MGGIRDGYLFERKTAARVTRQDQFTDIYGGTSAIDIRVTTWLTVGEPSIVDDYYYDASSGKLLAVTENSTVNGKATTKIIQANKATGMQIPDFSKGGTLTFVDTEPVFVPAGTYPDASKYTLTGVGTIWSAAGVPIPVQIIDNTSQMSVVMKLVAFG